MTAYVTYYDREGDSAKFGGYYPSIFPGLKEIMPDGIDYEGPDVQPEEREGYVSRKHVMLEGEGAPLIYYTYEPAPEPEETQLQRMEKELAEARAENAENKGAIMELTMYVSTLS